MLMYRITHKVTARGVYSHNAYCYDTSSLDQYLDWRLDDISVIHGSIMNSKRTPARCDDELIEVVDCNTENRMIYGFESLEHLKRWFNYDELDTLEDIGFHIIVLEVDKYARYNKQMVINLDHLDEVQVVDIIRIKDMP